MKKLKFIAGGQPFRSTDFEVMQTAHITGIRDLFNGITDVPTILSGLVYSTTTESGAAVIIPAGSIYDLYEICSVPSFSFNYDSSKALYLRRAEVLSSERMIGSTPQFVLLDVIYEVKYLTTPVAGDLPLAGMPRLNVITDQAYELVQDSHTALGSGFTSQSGYNGMYNFVNAANDRMIICMFMASATTGTLATLPVNMRPKFDLTGWFRAGDTVMPFSILTNGNVSIKGAAISGVNVVMFRYSVGFTFTP